MCERKKEKNITIKFRIKFRIKFSFEDVFADVTVYNIY